MKSISELREENILEIELHKAGKLIIETFNYVKFGDTGSWNVLIIDHVNKKYKWDYDIEPKKSISNKILAFLKIENYNKVKY